MKRDGWQRGAALGGVVFVVVNTAVGLAGSEPPSMNASAAEAAGHFAEHADAVEAGLWLFGLGVIGLLWWFGALYQWMGRTRQSAGLACTSLAGFAIGGSLSFAASAVWAAGSLLAADLGNRASLLNVVGWELRAASGFGIAVHILATSALAVRDRSLHLLLVGVGVLSALGFVISGVAASVSTSGSADLAGLFAVVLYSVWVLGLSHRLWSWDSAETGSASAGLAVNRTA